MNFGNDIRAESAERVIREHLLDNLESAGLIAPHTNMDALNLVDLTELYFMANIDQNYAAATTLSNLRPGVDPMAPLVSASVVATDPNLDPDTQVQVLQLQGQISRVEDDLNDKLLLFSAFNGQYDAPMLPPDLALLEIAARILIEPIDWVMTGAEVIQDIREGDWGSAAINTTLAVLPGVSGNVDNIVRTLDSTFHLGIGDLASRYWSSRGVRRLSDFMADAGLVGRDTRAFTFLGPDTNVEQLYMTYLAQEGLAATRDNYETFLRSRRWGVQKSHNGVEYEVGLELGAYYLPGGSTIYVLGDTIFERSPEGIIVPRPVSPIPEDTTSLYGSVFTHNHPSGDYLSRQDVDRMIRNGLSEIRATNVDYTISISWPDWSKFSKEQRREMAHDIANRLRQHQNDLLNSTSLTRSNETRMVTAPYDNVDYPFQITITYHDSGA